LSELQGKPGQNAAGFRVMPEKSINGESRKGEQSHTKSTLLLEMPSLQICPFHFTASNLIGGFRLSAGFNSFLDFPSNFLLFYSCKMHTNLSSRCFHVGFSFSKQSRSPQTAPRAECSSGTGVSESSEMPTTALHRKGGD
jgi:hypothetical protein